VSGNPIPDALSVFQKHFLQNKANLGKDVTLEASANTIADGVD
jgi:hypothetical protein